MAATDVNTTDCPPWTMLSQEGQDAAGVTKGEKKQEGNDTEEVAKMKIGAVSGDTEIVIDVDEPEETVRVCGVLLPALDKEAVGDEPAAKSIGESARSFQDLTSGANTSMFASMHPLTTAWMKTPLQVVISICGIVMLSNVLGGISDCLRCNVAAASALWASVGCFASAAVGRWGGTHRRLAPHICAQSLAIRGIVFLINGITFLAEGNGSGYSGLFNFVVYLGMCVATSVRQTAWPQIFTMLSIGIAVQAALFEDGRLVNIVSSGVFFCVVAYFYTMRKVISYKCVKECRPDMEKYNEIWARIIQTDHSALCELDSWAAQQPHKRVRQPDVNLNDLYLKATRLNSWFQEVVGIWVANLVAQGIEVQHKRAPLKKEKRVLEKLYRAYKGDVGRLLDLVRSTLVVKNIEAILAVAKHVSDNAVVHNVKNRFATKYDGKDTCGYRDLNMSISFKELEDTAFGPHVFELQVHLDQILEIKSDAGHKRYIRMRNLRSD